MVTLKTIALTLVLISSFFISTQGVDKYTDENRPYEFGFNIEGEQHRHEKKDEKGLIMGEFGFITADGVYHVTVYATDEEGRFKILSMKNIRVKPYPTYKQSSGSERQGHSLETSAPQQTLSQETSPIEKPGIPLKKVMIEKPGRSCSSCSLPTTTSAPVPVIVQPNIQNTPIISNPNFGQNPVQTNSQYPQEPKTNSFPNQQNFPANQQNNYNSPQTPVAKTNSFPNQVNFPANQQNNFNSAQSPSYSQNGPAGNRNLPQSPPEQGLVAPKEDLPLYPPLDRPLDYPQGPGSNYPAQPNGPSYTGQPDVNPVGRTAKKLDDAPQQRFNSVGAQPNAAFNPNEEPPKKPTLISAQMQIVDKNTDIYRRGPGEKEGLPDGLTTNDMSQLLYTFNYTVGFHGHFEEGYRNGAKQGYYFVTGRNGVRTRVDYVADEKGFRPKITQEVLDLLSEDVPKPETEKEEKYGLKGYEFKWLYFPVDPKRR